jgi:MFS family permease
MSSLRSYMFYQLKSFDPSLPDSTISYQAGMLAAGFTFAQMLTAVVWGKAADSEYIGRKKVLLVGLLGTGISALGFGFSKTFWVAMMFRVIGGMLNGNVGVMRTVSPSPIFLDGLDSNKKQMVSEMVKEKKYQSRAFMIMPMTGNIGQIIGPMLGGFLADPAGSYPSLFGKNSFFGGTDGVQWMIKYPYALPNLVSAMFLIGSAFIIILGLEEVK